MSDEVRSNSRPAPPDAGGLSSESADGPNSLEIEFPAPEVEPSDSGPVPTRAPGTLGATGDSQDGERIALLPSKDVASLRPEAESEPPPARHSERPPPPSQRMAHRYAPTGPAVPPPRPAERPPAAEPLPVMEHVPAPERALRAGAARAGEPPPSADGASQGDTFRHAERPRSGDGAVSAGPYEWAVTEPAPPPRMLSEPVPLTKTIGGPQPPRNTLRPGLVEPKRIIEVLGSNVPVLDSALEEDIEDLDESEAYELSETPPPVQALPSPEPELDLPVEVEEDLPAAAAQPSQPLGDAEPDVLRASAQDASAPAPARRDTLPEIDAEPVRSERETAPDAPEESSAEASARLDAPLDAADAARRVKAPPNKRRRPPPPSSRAAERLKPVEPSPAGARKWWEEMFSEEFLRAIPILSPKQLAREVDFIDESLSVERGGRILDLACGAGQHAVELASRGYDLVGFDLSQSQLDWAGGLAQERNQRLQFTCGDMRELSYSEAFDAVYCWNTSFGFFEEDKNVDVAQRVFRALLPGGRLLLDVINRDFVVAQQPGQTWFEGDGCVCIDDVNIDFITSRMKVKRTLMLTNGKNRECSYSLRIYGLHELGKILHDVGFKILTVSGRPETPGVFFGSTSPRIIILALKP